MHNHVLSIHTYVFLDKFTSMADLKHVACECVEENADKLNRLSQDIWNNPELGFEEFHAHEILTKCLEENGFEVQRKHKLETAFCAVYQAILCCHSVLSPINLLSCVVSSTRKNFQQFVYNWKNSLCVVISPLIVQKTIPI